MCEWGEWGRGGCGRKHHQIHLDTSIYYEVYYESRKRELKRRLINEGRCDERLKAKVEESTCLNLVGWAIGWLSVEPLGRHFCVPILQGRKAPKWEKCPHKMLVFLRCKIALVVCMYVLMHEDNFVCWFIPRSAYNKSHKSMITRHNDPVCWAVLELLQIIEKSIQSYIYTIHATLLTYTKFDGSSNADPFVP